MVRLKHANDEKSTTPGREFHCLINEHVCECLNWSERSAGTVSLGHGSGGHGERKPITGEGVEPLAGFL